METAIDRLKTKIFEFHETEMMPPTWVKLHPHTYKSLRRDSEPSYTPETGTLSPIMGLTVHIDPSKDLDYIEVGREVGDY